MLYRKFFLRISQAASITPRDLQLDAFLGFFSTKVGGL